MKVDSKVILAQLGADTSLVEFLRLIAQCMDGSGPGFEVAEFGIPGVHSGQAFVFNFTVRREWLPVVSDDTAH